MRWVDSRQEARVCMGVDLVLNQTMLVWKIRIDGMIQFFRWFLEWLFSGLSLFVSLLL